MGGSLRAKALHGTVWSVVERMSVQFVQFVITIVMARLLTPNDYGLIGMLAIFMALSQVFIDGGFSSALIQKNDRTSADYTTVFYINLFISMLVYGVLFFSAPWIAVFYAQPILSPILRVYALNLIINSLVAVHKTYLTINLDFKTQAKITLISAILSGIIGIIVAYNGAGVWALVIQSISMAIFNVVFTYYWVSWHPTLVFSSESFHKLFTFGSKLLVASVISAVYDNLYNLVIGKKFTSSDLGNYSRAQSFPVLVSSTIGTVLMRVSYPVLSSVQDDNQKLLNIYKKYIQLSSFILFPLMMILCGIAQPLILTLLTDKWLQCVTLLQILCFSSMWNCIISINLNLLKVKGRSDLVLKLEVVKKTIAVSILLITLLFHNILILCLGMVLYSLIALYINTHYTAKLLGYGFFLQVKDFGAYFLASLVVLAICLFISSICKYITISVFIAPVVSLSLYVIICKLCHLDALNEAILSVNTLLKK